MMASLKKALNWRWFDIASFRFRWTCENLCGMLLYCKGGATMARITVQDVYNGAKYDVMSAAVTDYLKNGRPAEYDERTWMDMLLVKHALIAAEKMNKEGDSISVMFDGESPSS